MISHGHKCIFVHIPKTGGTSVEVALQGHPEPDSIIHKTALEYKNQNSDIWDDYFKFTIVRNPWDLMVSWWKWRMRNKKTTFPGFIKNQKNLIPGNEYLKPGLTYFDFISDGNNILVDKICRFENLQEDFDDVCKEIGIIPQQKLPHKNEMKRTHYSDYYDDKIRKRVADKFKKDIEYFNYEY
jgi:chondroitin 4-sulfotransferase 11